MSMEADKKISNHVEITKFFGEHTIVTPPRSGFKEALIKKINDEYVNSSSDTFSIRLPYKYISAFFSFILITFFSLFTGFFVFYNNLTFGTLTSNNRVAASVYYFEGIVQRLDRSGNWQDLKINDVLNEGDNIRVMAGSRAVISFDGRGDMRLDSSSKIQLNSLKSNHIIVTNLEGEVYTRVEKDGHSVFEILVDDISYQSLGTAFKTINTETKKGVEVYESKVKISKDGKEQVVVAEGNKFYVRNTEDPSKENVIDEVVLEEIAQDSFVIWNKEQDKTKFVQEDLGILAKTDPLVPQVTINVSTKEEGIQLSWDGTNIPEGSEIKVILGEGEDLTLSEASEVLGVEGLNDLLVQKEDGGEYTIKACVYVDNSCLSYSAPIKIKAPGPVVGAEVPPQPILKSISLSTEETIDGIFLQWYLEPENTTGIKGIKIMYDELLSTGEVVNNEMTINDLKERKLVIYLIDSEINSFIKVCALNNKNECFVESNTISFLKPQEIEILPPIEEETLPNEFPL